MPAAMPTGTSDSAFFQADFPPDEFAARRARITDAIGPGAHALLQGAPPMRGFALFRQSNEFYYCCGIAVPQAYLLLNGGERTATLFLPRRPEGKSGEGATLAADDAELITRHTGLSAVQPLEALAQHLEKASVLYTPHSPAEGWMASRGELARADQSVAADPWDGRPTREQNLINVLKTRVRVSEIRDLSPILDGLRAVKSAREIELLRRAGQLSALAVTEAMRATKPGMPEYQLGAMARYVYLLHGARGEGYRDIIASGRNAWFGHYFRNDSVMQDGDLVLMDTAPDYRYYTSDIGRMFPINGRYAPWQRELYGFMVEYHRTVLARIRPGVTADRIHEEAAAEMAKVLSRTAFSKAVYQQAAERTLKFKGHLSHAVGMAVHDVGNYQAGPLRPGAVFAVDPQMWVPEEKLYIRVEDTVVVTDNGIENLTRAAPLELDDVEACMREEARFPSVSLPWA
ncbi:MAG: aminopeptidase P N-terminal domain-containing protein [Planctomycetota bacterium]|nr:aminopeptidase P N-terminal domain-containing protein [Planctomycetota bacterium]